MGLLVPVAASARTLQVPRCNGGRLAQSTHLHEQALVSRASRGFVQAPRWVLRPAGHAGWNGGISPQSSRSKRGQADASSSQNRPRERMRRSSGGRAAALRGYRGAQVHTNRKLLASYHSATNAAACSGANQHRCICTAALAQEMKTGVVAATVAYPTVSQSAARSVTVPRAVPGAKARVALSSAAKVRFPRALAAAVRLEEEQGPL